MCYNIVLLSLIQENRGTWGTRIEESQIGWDTERERGNNREQGNRKLLHFHLKAVPQLGLLRIEGGNHFHFSGRLMLSRKVEVASKWRKVAVQNKTKSYLSLISLWDKIKDDALIYSFSWMNIQYMFNTLSSIDRICGKMLITTNNHFDLQKKINITVRHLQWK